METVDLPLVASITGMPGITRKARIDPAVITTATTFAHKKLGRPANDLIVASLDAEGFVVAISGGEVIDGSDKNEHGPFCLKTAGGLPVRAVADICAAAESDPGLFLCKKGGLSGYLGVETFADVDRLLRDGNSRAIEIVSAMVYQLAKEIGGLVAALGKKPDAIVIAGSGSEYDRIVQPLVVKIGYLSPLVAVCTRPED